MLMPSQSPSSTTTIQTLPSDQQQQQQKKQRDEYVDTFHSQKNNANHRIRREKSMEFDDDSRFGTHNTDDINNNYSINEQIDEMNKSESDDSLPSSSADEELPLTVSMPLSTPAVSNMNVSTLSDSVSIIPSKRRIIRPASNRRIIGDHDQSISITINEPDPNVFLISSDTNSHNTIRKTKHDVKRFVMYIEEQFSEQKPLHTIAPESLCQYLKHYFENTKKFDGTQYEPDTLRSFLLSIERYLKSKSYEHNLMESPLFQSCRQVIINKREQWKKITGNNHSNHNHHHSTKSSVVSLNFKHVNTFDRTKPDGLLLEIYTHIHKLFQEKPFPAAQLLWGDIGLVDNQYLIVQNKKSDAQTIKVSATPVQQSTCPIQAYLLYATHRPPQCNTSQSPFFLMPRATATNQTWYKTTAAGKNLEQVLQHAFQQIKSPKQSSTSSSLSSYNISDHSSSLPFSNQFFAGPISNGKRNESCLSSSNLLPYAKRMQTSNVSVQPLNLSVGNINPSVEDDSRTASSSPSNSSSNEMKYSSLLNKSSPPLMDIFQKMPISSTTVALPWDESVTEILLTVAKQRDTRLVKINILRGYLEEKLGVVEFLCLYRGFKSEPKLTFHGTPWEHYQRFLPVLFTLLALDNTII